MAATRKSLAQLVQHVKHVPLAFILADTLQCPLLLCDSIPCTLLMDAHRNHHIFVQGFDALLCCSRSFMSVHCHRSCHLCSGRNKVMHRRSCDLLAACAHQFCQWLPTEPVQHAHCRTREQAKLRLVQMVLPSWRPSPTAWQQTARLPRRRRQLNLQGPSPRRGPALTLGSTPLR